MYTHAGQVLMSGTYKIRMYFRHFLFTYKLDDLAPNSSGSFLNNRLQSRFTRHGGEVRHQFCAWTHRRTRRCDSSWTPPCHAFYISAFRNTRVRAPFEDHAQVCEPHPRATALMPNRTLGAVRPPGQADGFSRFEVRRHKLRIITRSGVRSLRIFAQTSQSTS